MKLAGALLLGGAAFAACAQPPAFLQRSDREVDPSPEVGGAGFLEPVAPGSLRVRLAGPEGAPELEIGGVAGGPVVLRRDGLEVRASNGERGRHLRLLPRAGADGLELGGRLYPGELWVTAAAEGGLGVENRVDLEDYVAGVVPAELVLWSAEPAEIEAQAVAARTYALRSLETRRSPAERFLWDDTRDQVYLGRYRGGDSAGARRVAARLVAGVARTRGLVLLDPDGALYDVRFHASCGGHTTSPAEAFPFESVWHHDPATCEPCRRIGAEERSWPAEDSRRRRVHWSWTLPAADLARLGAELGLGGPPYVLADPQVDRHGRWQSVELRAGPRTERLSLRELRRRVGAADLKSGRILKTWPPLGQPIAGGLLLEGLGRGHGAGLCQVGSHEVALQGWNAERILAHYLPASRLAQLPAAGTVDH